jgi:hypothetical protein
MSPRRCLIAVLATTAGWLVRPPARAAEEAGPPPRPMMIAEAKLPQGFPAPGPVGRVIAKEYPAHRLARTAADDQGSDSMFMRLFRHIKRHDIAMTAPVEMAAAESGGGDASPASMAFLYATPETGRAGPDPGDAGVVVEDVPATAFVSIGVRGSYTERTFGRGRDQLQKWLADHPEWTAAGPPRTLAYNSPFVPGMLKYAEVQIPVVPSPPPSQSPAAE